jgi:hypothetical protein
VGEDPCGRSGSPGDRPQKLGVGGVGRDVRRAGLIGAVADRDLDHHVDQSGPFGSAQSVAVGDGPDVAGRLGRRGQVLGGGDVVVVKLRVQSGRLGQLDRINRARVLPVDQSHRPFGRASRFQGPVSQ